jgi:hypothetical protein
LKSREEVFVKREFRVREEVCAEGLKAAGKGEEGSNRSSASVGDLQRWRAQGSGEIRG